MPFASPGVAEHVVSGASGWSACPAKPSTLHPVVCGRRAGTCLGHGLLADLIGHCQGVGAFGISIIATPGYFDTLCFKGERQLPSRTVSFTTSFDGFPADRRHRIRHTQGCVFRVVRNNPLRIAETPMSYPQDLGFRNGPHVRVMSIAWRRWRTPHRAQEDRKYTALREIGTKNAVLT